jgi:hypothetical protein
VQFFIFKICLTRHLAFLIEVTTSKRRAPQFAEFNVGLQSGFDPTAGSGFIANGKFLQLLDTFAYNQSYRIRSVVDQIQGTQEASILDDFGKVTTAGTPQPFAQGTTVTPNILTIGNGTTLRATDTLLDFVFLRPAAQIEPQITFSRIR